jgi:RsiW-degrading membrane proteinase PrsW (M82 family)
MKLIEIAILFVMAFLPALIYTMWIRNTEKYNREKWIPIILCFLWGATIAVIASIILEIVFQEIAVFVVDDPSIYLIITVSVIAPFAEELTKPLALSLKRVKKELVEPEDGLIYGAVAGLGFSATENLFYGADAFLSEGLLYFILLISIRSFSGCLLHASATAWTGYGYGKVVMKHTRLIRVLPYFILAIIVHGFYNFIPIYGMLTGFFILFLGALLFVMISILIVRKKIITLDASKH